ncbi:hypothetical protein N7510_000300 [Penicillium lagena]|uniref:uncharacterized protein n=1 Tax=Penicillium lagena TaxID=94218 RepID=UPI002541E1D8|nr:uncharacterized protein N7510_000300 [Penicillium lagena]KAJ5623991.1 hypothetical protein N7510_000300 [Penicillium lagena]
MAVDRHRGSLGRPSLLAVLLMLFHCGAAQFCSFWNTGCVDPVAQTAVSLQFQPVFPDPVTFFYGFDASPLGKGEGPMTKVAYWLRYQDNHVNHDAVDANRTSEVALRIGNITGVPSGGNNGCDGIWGPPCSEDLKGSLRNTMFHMATSGEYHHKPLEAALAHMIAWPPTLETCPPQMFEVASIPVQEFVLESMPDQRVSVMTPGTSGHPWQIWYLDDMTTQSQASEVAVGIISRAPSYNGPPPLSPDDIQVQLICLQAPSGRSSGSD